MENDFQTFNYAVILCIPKNEFGEKKILVVDYLSSSGEQIRLPAGVFIFNDLLWTLEKFNLKKESEELKKIENDYQKIKEKSQGLNYGAQNKIFSIFTNKLLSFVKKLDLSDEDFNNIFNETFLNTVNRTLKGELGVKSGNIANIIFFKHKKIRRHHKFGYLIELSDYNVQTPFGHKEILSCYFLPIPLVRNFIFSSHYFLLENL